MNHARPRGSDNPVVDWTPVMPITLSSPMLPWTLSTARLQARRRVMRERVGGHYRRW
jgi:hypothetical protein